MESNFAAFTKIGGIGFIVEIDETHLYKRKHNTGRPVLAQWLVGGKCRGTNQRFLVLVPDRTSATMKQVIDTYVAPGTVIHTDGWRSYVSACAELGFEHHIINHSENFVSSEDASVHIQGIESLWGDYKRWMKHHCFDRGARRNVEQYLTE